MVKSNKMPEDPFFTIFKDPEWNCLTGTQSCNQNYIEGYLDAPIDLIDSVISSNNYSKRDTLIMPILYSIRHGLELSLKHFSVKLSDMYKWKDLPSPNHDIKAFYDYLCKKAIPDKMFREQLDLLGSFVSSLSQVDPDGQQFRFSTTVKGDVSLSDTPLCNLMVIRDSALKMNEVLRKLLYRLDTLNDELKSGTHTKKLSRTDLKDIASRLPNFSEWADDAEGNFTTSKGSVQKDYDLSNNDFSKAVDCIKKSRELSLLIEYRHEVSDIDINMVRAFVSECKKTKTSICEFSGLGTDYWSLDRSKMYDSIRLEQEIHKKLCEIYDCSAVACIEALFDLGRDGVFVERYEEYYQSSLDKCKDELGLSTVVNRILEKTNLVECIKISLEYMGYKDALKDL